MSLKFLSGQGIDGNVGIGTNVPERLLSLYSDNAETTPRLLIEQDGTGDAVMAFSLTSGQGWSMGIDNSGADAFMIHNSSGGVDSSSQFTILDGGNVGIGTTSPNKLLDVSSDNTPTIRITNTLQSSSNYTAGVFEFYSEDASTPGGARVLSSILCVNNAGSAVPNGNLAFYTALGGGSGAAATEKMRITSAGNVGIGTTSPDAKLVIEDVTKSLTGNVAGTAQGTLSLVSSDALAVDIGASMVFGGNYITGSNTKIAYAAIAGRKEFAASANADGYLAFYTWLTTGMTEKMRITPAGNVGIGITTPTSKLHISQTVTNPDLDLPQSFAVEIDSNHSGSTATTGDREQGGLYIDVDSSTTGGDTSDEHRVYGIYSTVNHSGDADRATGIYTLAEQNTTAGSTAYVLGGEFIAVTDGGASAAVNTVAGVWGSCSIQDATPLINSYGGYFRNSQAANRTGSTSSTYGLYTEVELNSDSAYTNIYGQRITIDVNTDAFTATNIYGLDFSFTGLTDIPAATNTYAINQPYDVKSYHAGNFGIASGNPESKLTVGGNAISTLKPTVAITDTTNGASLTLRGVSPVLYFDKTGAGVPKILMDGGGLEFKTGTLDAEGDVDFKINADGSLQLAKGAKISNQENTDIDSAAAEVVAQVAISYTAAFFDFVVKKGTNVRSGTVYACHDGTNVEFTETSTNDLGDTSDVTLSVDKTSTNLRLIATVTSDDWSVKSLIRAI